MVEDRQGQVPARTHFDAAEMGALAHLYRAEIYRSTLARARLDQTTNWAVVTTGLALSLSFAGPRASPLPMILVGLLIVVFLLFEGRRYRYYSVWRARSRLMETDFIVPMLRGDGVARNGEWNMLLAEDYARPRFHVSFVRSIGRRLRKTYAYILSVQAIAYYGKLAVHPVAADHLTEFLDRAAIGPVPGLAVVLAGLLFHGTWIVLAVVTLLMEQPYRRVQGQVTIG